MGHELKVVAEALYVARFDPVWARRPYWMLRRCVAPYVAVGQFLVLRRDGLPVAFAGWARETPGRATPWRENRYLPTRDEIVGDGDCCVVDLLSPFVPAARVLDEVRRFVGGACPVHWVEYDADRVLVAVHGDPHIRKA